MGHMGSYYNMWIYNTRSHTWGRSSQRTLILDIRARERYSQCTRELYSTHAKPTGMGGMEARGERTVPSYGGHLPKPTVAVAARSSAAVRPTPPACVSVQDIL